MTQNCYPNDPAGSTKNPGGNAPVRGGNDPFAYLKIGPHHAHLGHFTQRKYLEEGHNTGPRRVKYTSASATHVSGQSRRASVVRSIDSLKAKTAKRAIRAGGEVGTAVAKERPVLAAKVAAKQRLREARQSGQKGAVKQARELNRASVKTARTSVDAARNERKAARQARRMSRFNERG